MTSIGSPSSFFFGGKKVYEIDRSLRFNRDDNAYLTRTPSSAGNRKTFTYSAWVKLGQTGINSSTNPGNGLFLSCGAGSGGANMTLRITNNGYIGIDYYGIGGYYSSGRLRDPSAWYHCVWVMDTTESTAANRMKVYVNGNLFYNNQMGLSQNADTPLNNNSATTIGAYSYSTSHAYRLDAYLAEVHFLDGYAYDPSYFAETNAATGQWNPKEYTGNYGSNGFYLNFSDNSGTTATTLGKDSSGNGNNFTPNNFATIDAFKDSPSNNFCVFNPLSKDGGTTLSDGNLEINSANYGNNTGTFFVTSGKWYWEGLGSGYVIAICGNDGQNYTGSASGTGSKSIGYWSNSGIAYWDGGNSGTGTSYSTADVVAAALDMDNGTIKFYKNNTLIHDLTFGSGTIPDLSAGVFPVYNNGQSNVSKTINYNFGQDSSFSGNKTAQGNTDGNGIGDFYYAPPSGYKALCSANLPDPSIKLPNKHFGTLLFTGNGGTQSITDSNAVDFTPDWVWIKTRSTSNWHFFFDAVRGVGRFLFSNSASVENGGGANPETSLTSFITNGFSLGADPTPSGSTGFNINSATHVAWNWNAGNTDGKTYAVKVHDFSGNNRYIFDDFQTQAVTLDLAEGGTYIFNMDDASNASHPFSIGTAANGTVYTSGITYFLDGVSKTYNEYTSGFAAATTRRLHITVPASALVLYYWCSAHSGMGGQINTNSTLGSSNFDGAIQSTVKVNATAGFSITAYPGNGSNAQTVGHGLGVAPDVIFLKSRTAGSNWRVWHHKLAADGSKRLLLDATNASEDASFLNDTAPSSTVFTLGNSDNAWNVSGGTYITYLFSEVAGYSKFGSYIGNGSSDGTFVFTGFRPAWIMIKRTDTTKSWAIFDNKRDPDNVASLFLYANTNGADNNSDFIDFLSNGFKFRTNSSVGNDGGNSYIYFAFAESPFKNARAR